MKTFVEKFIAEYNETELDLCYPFYDKDEYDDDERNVVMIPHHLLAHTEAPSISIDRVIKILSEFKEEGADRVYIAQHGDHHGYYFYGVELKEI